MLANMKPVLIWMIVCPLQSQQSCFNYEMITEKKTLQYLLIIKLIDVPMWKSFQDQ